MISTIAIDDEPLALRLITSYVQRTPFLNLVGSFDNPLVAMEYIHNHDVKAVFLDIQMPDLTGTDFAKLLGGGPKVVFTTAYEQFALEGFKLDVVDYLLKPFGYEEFLRSANRLRDRLESASQPAVEVKADHDFLFIKTEHKIRRINFDEILFIEGLKDYVKIFLKGVPRPLLSLITLKSLEARLPNDRFMRVHRSFIVNLQQISLIERNQIVFGEVHVPVGDQYKEVFQAWVEKNFII